MTKVIVLHDLKSNDEIRVFTNRIRTYRIVTKDGIDPATDAEFYDKKTGNIRNDFKEHSALFEDGRALPYSVRELPDEIDAMINK